MRRGRIIGAFSDRGAGPSRTSPMAIYPYAPRLMIEASHGCPIAVRARLSANLATDGTVCRIVRALEISRWRRAMASFCSSGVADQLSGGINPPDLRKRLLFSAALLAFDPTTFRTPSSVSVCLIVQQHDQVEEGLYLEGIPSGEWGRRRRPLGRKRRRAGGRRLSRSLSMRRQVWGWQEDCSTAARERCVPSIQSRSPFE